MSNYTKTTDFAVKDTLNTGDPDKIIRGSEFEVEFDNIAVAIASKSDLAGPTFTGTLTFETISDGTIDITAFVDEDDMSSDSATLVPTQQSVKAYVDSQVTAQDLDFQADSGGALSIDLDSETLLLTGGTGIDTAGSGNEVTFNIDSTVATLTGSQTLTNKTLTSPDVNTPDIDGGTIDGTVIGGSSTAAGSFTSVNATSLDVAGTVEFNGLSGTGSVTVTDILDQDNMSSNSATALATQQSIKSYVDSQVTAQDLDVTTDGGTIAIDLDSEVLSIVGGEGIDTSATGNTVTIAGEDASTTNKGVASFDPADFIVTSGEAHLATSAAAFGAVGDGSNDDTAALQAAMDSVAVSGVWLDGGNKTYLITDEIEVDVGEFCRLRNFKFKINTGYTGTAHGRINCQRTDNTHKMTIALDNVVLDGGRDSYKTGNETWKTTGSSFGSSPSYDNIEPTISAFFRVESLNEDTTVHVTNCRLENYHGIAGIRVNSYGTTVIQGCVFKNLSFQSFAVYQAVFDENDNITAHKGRTFVSNVYAEDVGLLPNTFDVTDSGTTSTINFSSTTVAPHQAYNFLAIGGEYNIVNATSKNYASCGVTADRNKKFNASNITITNDSTQSFSNNPSGAFWIEGCEEANVTNLTVDVTARATIDTTGLDNSLLQIYLINGNKAFFNNVFLKTDASTAYVNKLIRGSSQHNTLCSITNFHVEGTCRNPADAISFLLLPGSQIQQDVRLSHGYLASGSIKVDNPNNLTIDDVYLTGNVIPFRAANASGESRTVGQVKARNSYKILTTGDGDFTAVGAASNSVGTVFVATTDGSYVSAGSFVSGVQYRIVSLNDGDGGANTDFTTIGAADNDIGTVFTATDVGTGTGTADINTGTAQLFIVDETHNVSIVNSYIGGNITNTTKLTESFNVSNNKYIDYITSSCADATAKIVVSDNAHIGGGVAFANANVTGPSSVKIQGNGLIEGVTRVDGTNNAIISNNNTERTITIEDVQHFQVIGNTAKTDAAEPCIYVNPTTPSNVLSGVINGNSCLVKAGTSGAGHVSIASSVTNVMEGVNNKLTVAWS